MPRNRPRLSRILLAFAGGLEAESQLEISREEPLGGTARKKRPNFDVSGCKSMNVNNYDGARPQSSRTARKSRSARKSETPSLVIALLGAVCVLGVFGLLGLLYSLG
jgi:hypothetical protein